MREAAAPGERSTAVDRRAPSGELVPPARVTQAEGPLPNAGRTGLSAVLVHSLALAACVIVIVAGVALFGLGGLRYYSTPLPSRGLEKAHRLLRPAGRAGLLFGIAGALMMLMTLPYAVRKKIPSLARRGNSKRWLEAHIFCGVVGPALITLHTSFKFNGLISVAYWSMLLVVLSGFVGRYLYVRIPRTIRGAELSLEEIRQRSAELYRRLHASGLPPGLAQKIDAEAVGRGIRAALAFRRRLGSIKKELRLRGMRADLLDEVSGLVAERALLVRRMETLERTKKLFDLWHVFHRPLVWLMFAIAAIHVSLAVYMGYSRIGF